MAYESVDNFFCYAVGFWWLSLEDNRQKTEYLKKHEVFGEKFTLNSCSNYATACKKIITSPRSEVIMQKVKMQTLRIIIRCCKNDEDIEKFLDVAIKTGASGRMIEDLIREQKTS